VNDQTRRRQSLKLMDRMCEVKAGCDWGRKRNAASGIARASVGFELKVARNSIVFRAV